jgi:hypothetical protein
MPIRSSHFKYTTSLLDQAQTQVQRHAIHTKTAKSAVVGVRKKRDDNARHNVESI